MRKKKDEKDKVVIPRLWDYKAEDETTWAYLDCIIAGKNTGNSNTLYVSKWIKNPNFKYAHLMRNY